MISQEASPSPEAYPAGILLIHLTDCCNLTCQHCYVDASPRGHRFLPASLVRGALDDARQMGIKTIYFSGGEPMLHPSLPALLATASENEDFALRLSTNGTLIDESWAIRMKRLGASAQISLDGRPAYHNAFRGSATAFTRTQAGIEALVAAGVPVSLVMTICNDNFDDLPWLAAWGAERGVTEISVQPLLELGRGAQIRQRRLSERQSCELFLQLSDLGYHYQAKGLRLRLVYRTRHFLLTHPCAAYVCNGRNCHRQVEKEIKKLVVREDGTILPEIPTLDRRYAIGDLHLGSLRQQVSVYMDNGYKRFDQLCRTIYSQVVPTWNSPIVPWDEIVSIHAAQAVDL